MKQPYELQNSDSEILCPECSSANIKLDEDHVTQTGSGVILKKYLCNDCGITFIPALVGSDAKNGQKKIKEWSKKIRTNEGLNEGKTWKEAKPEYIIIKKK